MRTFTMRQRVSHETCMIGLNAVIKPKGADTQVKYEDSP